MSLNGNSDETNGYNSVIKNGVLANANLVKSTIPPIGAVLSWLKNLGTTHTPALPDGWVECNGQVLSDTDSPYNGDTIPNLNAGTYRMLRGAATSGGTGGADTHIHMWHEAGTGTFDSDGVTTHALDFQDNLDESTTNVVLQNQSNACYTNVQSSLPAYYAVVWIMRVK